MKRMASLFVSALLAMVVSHAEAALIVGDFDISNEVGATTQWVTSTSNPSSLGPATALDFSPGLVNASNPTGANFKITGASGDFLPLLGAQGNIIDFTFITGAAFAGFPEAPVAAWEVVLGGGLTVDLLSITSVSKKCPTCSDPPTTPCPGCTEVSTDGSVALNIAGFARFKMPGFEDTIGIFQFTSTGNTGASTFAFAAHEQTIPEPGTLLLLGAGLVTAGGVARRFRR